MAARDLVCSQTGRVNSFGFNTILEITPNLAWFIISYNSSSVTCPNALGIHNAGYSYAVSEVVAVAAAEAAVSLSISDLFDSSSVVYNINQFFVVDKQNSINNIIDIM